eukprot:TRINITY_DN6810_c0_g1_i2.p2 TRINITY_DN6810_c0_g1~~TRINITY_DN6810_c0_g1_i2.p2  ORF type:complete len:127 (-),score=18.59 TRINITY_DN6810_c0_g1_i2:48-428(-)
MQQPERAIADRFTSGGKIACNAVVDGRDSDAHLLAASQPSRPGIVTVASLVPQEGLEAVLFTAQEWEPLFVARYIATKPDIQVTAIGNVVTEQHLAAEGRHSLQHPEQHSKETVWWCSEHDSGLYR